MEKTVGNMIDELGITNHRIWVLEDICRDPKATDKQIADAKKKINVCNQYRTELIQGIDRALGKNSSQAEIKIYGKE